MASAQKPLVSPRLILGFITFLLGLLFLADATGMASADSGVALWPLGVIAVGLMLTTQPSTANLTTGLILVLAGFWLLFNEFGIWTYSFWDTWPVMLIAFGAWMLYRTHQMRGRAGGEAGFDEATTAATEIGAFAFFSEVDRKTEGQVLASGELSAVLGGCTFDLTNAKLGPTPVVIDAFALLGRIEIKVPEGWEVNQRVLPLLGKATDSRPEPDEPAASPDASSTESTEPVFDLVVQGSAIYGVVDISTVDDPTAA